MQFYLIVSSRIDQKKIDTRSQTDDFFIMTVEMRQHRHNRVTSYMYLEYCEILHNCMDVICVYIMHGYIISSTRTGMPHFHQQHNHPQQLHGLSFFTNKTVRYFLYYPSNHNDILFVQLESNGFIYFTPFALVGITVALLGRLFIVLTTTQTTQLQTEAIANFIESETGRE